MCSFVVGWTNAVGVAFRLSLSLQLTERERSGFKSLEKEAALKKNRAHKSLPRPGGAVNCLDELLNKSIHGRQRYAGRSEKAKGAVGSAQA